MEPTIQNSDIVFAENLSRHFHGIHRGDIVIAKSPSDPRSNICKRVIGLEGDKILTTSPSDFFKSHSYVPTGHVWLEGDNLQNSTDSRYYGPIPYGLIRGRIFFKVQLSCSLYSIQINFEIFRLSVNLTIGMMTFYEHVGIFSISMYQTLQPTFPCTHIQIGN
ncbi:mitochondrial inner membrane protease subunit 1 isoform X3 [Ochotona curzoniae]|nr:mitochondrial inner membrane protease subunit 1 isoform X3 [Ochotona curzoniae]